MRKLLLIACLSIAMLAGCGSSADVATDIIGEWEGQDTPQNLVFYEDGQMEIKSRKHSDHWGEYMIEDGNKLTFNIPDFQNLIKCTADIRGDKMSLVHPSGREEKYKRL